MSTKATAARIYDYGEHDVFRFETMDVPDPVGHEVLVRNTVIGLNFVDIYYRRGTLPVPGFPTIIGDEASGVVEGEDQRGIGISLFCQTRSLQLRRCLLNQSG
jgi:NADPH2:quinone reductase